MKIIAVIKNILLVVIVIYIIILLYFVFTEGRYVYLPSRAVNKTPASAGLNFEEIYFKTSDNVEISGWFIPARERRGTMLFCHGTTGNISDRLDLLGMFNSLGLDILIFDYRGYGKSSGKPSENGTYLDSEAAYHYLIGKKKAPVSEIIIYGRSLGGPVAARLAAQNPARALILESSFTSMKELSEPYYLFIPAKFFSRVKYNTMEYLEKVEVPVLVAHSSDDEVIPFSHGQELYKTVSGEKKFVELNGFHNNGSVKSSKKYLKELNSFLNSIGL